LSAEVTLLDAAVLKHSGPHSKPAAVIGLTQDMRGLLPYADDEEGTGEVCDACGEA
jgi:hypothetical protein